MKVFIKYFILSLLICFSLNSLGQFGYVPQTAAGYWFKGIGADSLMIPTGCGKPTGHVNIISRHSALFTDTCNHLVWFYDPHISDWDTLGGSSGGISIIDTGDITNILNIINNYSNTNTLTFRARTGLEWDSITGPNNGANDYTPLYVAGDSSVLQDKWVYEVIRNNVPATRGIDYFFNSSSGTINFTESVNNDELFQVFYSSTPYLENDNQDTTGSGGDGDDTTGVGPPGDTTTHFGMIYTGTDISTAEKLQMTQSPIYGFNLIRTSIKMNQWDGSDNFMDHIMADGGDTVKVILNLNKAEVGRNAQGDKVSNLFLQPSEYGRWDAFVNAVLTKYQDIILILVIENEPTTKNFYHGSVLDYIAQINHTIPIAHSYGIPIADGCVHLGYVQSIMNGNLGSVNTRQVDTIIDAYPSMDLDYTNFHTASPNSPTWNEDVKGICDYLRAHNGGKPIISNEWHFEASYPSLAYQIVGKMREAEVKYSICLDPGAIGAGGVAMHVIGTLQLNELGNAFKDAAHH